MTLPFGSDDDEKYRINTVSTLKDGKAPTAWERRSFDNLVRKIGADLAETVPKLRPGMDEGEYAQMARKECRKVMTEWRSRLQKQGKLPVPGGKPD